MDISFSFAIKAPYPMETKILVQTLETPTRATGSPSKGTGQIWGNLHLGASLTPPPDLLLLHVAPSTRLLPFRPGSVPPPSVCRSFPILGTSARALGQYERIAPARA